MQLIILASGRGSRLGDLTINKPKCLVNVNDKSIIDYQRKIFKYFKTIIIIVGYKGYLIKKNLKTLKISHSLRINIFVKQIWFIHYVLQKNISTRIQ